MHIYSDPKSSYIDAFLELPGMRNSDIRVQVTADGKLIVSGERQPPAYIQNVDDYHRLCPVHEFKFGRFAREIDVPYGLEVGPPC